MSRHEMRRSRGRWALRDEERHHRIPAVERMSPPRTLRKKRPRGAAVLVKSVPTVGPSSTAVIYLVCGVLLLPAAVSDGEDCYCDRQG